MKTAYVIALSLLLALFVLGLQSFAENQEKDMKNELVELQKATFAGGVSGARSRTLKRSTALSK